MRSSTARLYHDHMLTKEPGTAPTDAVAPGSAVLQHRRQARTSASGSRWTREPRFHPGVRRGLASRAVADAALVHGLAGEVVSGGERWRICPTSRRGAREFSILGWELQPGDAVCFHMLTLHAARGVESARRRRVFSVRFLGDDITHAPRRWKTSPEFPGLAEQLPAGAPMRSCVVSGALAGPLSVAPAQAPPS